MAKGARKSAGRRVMKKALKAKQGGKDLYGIKQGVGAVTASAYPKRAARRRNPRGVQCTAAMAKRYLNANNPAHLPLPRAVGGYTTIRTTDVIEDIGTGAMFGAFKGPGNQFTETCWLDILGVRPAGGGLDLAVSSAANPNGNGGNAVFMTSAALSAGSLNGARLVPAAITIQVMNSESMQNADGIAYIGRSKTVLDLMGDTRTWRTVFNELVAYSSPRLCSGGKLALRGVQVNAIPNNLSVLSDFVPRRIAVSGQHVWTEATFATDLEGFAPIFIYNPDEIGLKVLVTIEWRMRFDPLNPAYAGHTVHTPASETTWSKVIADAEAMGHGVEDIADVAADAGMAALPFIMAA